MVKLAIQQPTYLPWLGYFEQIARCDVFVFLDSVQFERHSWQNRNRLRTVAGKRFWLTVPVEHAPLHTPIKDITVLRKNDVWVRKHINSLQASLGRAPYFKTFGHLIERWIGHDVLMLADLNIALITDIARSLGLNPTFIRASDLSLTQSKSALVVEICRHIGASRYYSAAGAQAYLEEHLFADIGVTLEYQTWAHPSYTQIGPGFTSHLSAVDALMNVGADQVRKMILPQSR